MSLTQSHDHVDKTLRDGDDEGGDSGGDGSPSALTAGSSGGRGGAAAAGGGGGGGDPNSTSPAAASSTTTTTTTATTTTTVGRKKWSVASVASMFGGTKQQANKEADNHQNSSPVGGGAGANKDKLPDERSGRASHASKGSGREDSNDEVSSDAAEGEGGGKSGGGSNGTGTSHRSPSSSGASPLEDAGREAARPFSSSAAAAAAAPVRGNPTNVGSSSSSLTPLSPTPSGINQFVESSTFADGDATRGAAHHGSSTGGGGCGGGTSSIPKRSMRGSSSSSTHKSTGTSSSSRHKHKASGGSSVASSPSSPTPGHHSNKLRKYGGGGGVSSSSHREGGGGGALSSSTSGPVPAGGGSDPVMDKLDSLFVERKSLHGDRRKSTAATTSNAPALIEEGSATEFHHDGSSSLHDSADWATTAGSGAGAAAAGSKAFSSSARSVVSTASGASSSNVSRSKVARTPSDRSTEQRSRLKASLLGTFLDSKPKLAAAASTSVVSGSGNQLNTNGAAVDGDARSTYSSFSKKATRNASSAASAAGLSASQSSKLNLSSSSLRSRDELMSFLSTLPKTLDKDGEKKSKKKKDDDVNDAGGPVSPDRGRRRKIGSAAMSSSSAAAIDPATAERRHRSRSRRARSKSRARSSKSAAAAASVAAEESGGPTPMSSVPPSGDDLKRSRKEEKRKESRKEEVRDEMRGSRRRSVRHLHDPDGKALSPRKEASSRSLVSKSESSRKLAKQESVRRKSTLMTTPELQDSQGSMPSIEMSPRSMLSPPSSTSGVRHSRRRSNETESHATTTSSRRRSEVATRRKSEVSTSTTSSRRAHKSDRERSDRHRPSAPPPAVPEEPEPSGVSPTTQKKKPNRHEEMIASPAARSKRSSSRVRSHSRSRSSLTPADMEIVTSPGKSPTSKRLSGRSKSVDPRKRRESIKAAAVGGGRTEEPRGRSRGTLDPSSGSPTNPPKSRGRSVSVGAKDRYSALLKNEDGTANRPKPQRFAEVEASEKFESSPGVGTGRTPVVAAVMTELPSIPMMGSHHVSDSGAVPKDAGPSAISARKASPSQNVHSGSTNTRGEADISTTEYNEEDVFSFYSWSSKRQDQQSIQRERRLLKEAIRETPLYRVYQHAHAA